MVIEGMAQTGAEPTYCMGDDVPLAVLASTPHLLYDYFKQRFAQVRVVVGGWAHWGPACLPACMHACLWW